MGFEDFGLHSAGFTSRLPMNIFSIFREWLFRKQAIK